MAKIFTLKFDEPDMMARNQPALHEQQDETARGSAWISRFTVCGDRATIELDVESGRFRLFQSGAARIRWCTEGRRQRHGRSTLPRARRGRIDDHTRPRPGVPGIPRSDRDTGSR